MIRVFRANDTNFNTNGEVILKPIEAIITKNIEEEYIEVECPLKYADFLVQDNVLLVDTLTGRKGYKIHNPIVGYTITAKAWLVWQENPPLPKDRGAVISHGKNIKDLEYQEDWDDVVTKLIPVGYKDIRLPEGHLSVPSPYQKVYERELEFDLSESLEEQVELLEEEVETNQSIVNSLENSIIVLTGRIHACASAIISLQAEKTALQQRLRELGDSEPEKKEKAIIEAQLPLIDEEIAKVEADRVNTEVALTQTEADLTTSQTEYEASKTEYETLIITDLRQQSQEHLNINMYPKINYDLEAHLKGVYEIGDTVRVKHPDMRVDLLTQVTAYQLDVISMKFRKIEFGTLKTSLRKELDEIEEKIAANKETVKKYGNTVTKYRSEYKRDNEEMVSKFMSELYGVQNGIYGLLQKNQSVFRQTASEISGTVSRVNADLSEDIASLIIKADSIISTVSNNYTALDGKITKNASQITQTASSIRSEVANTLKSYSTTTQMNSSITQSASSIRSEVSTAINGVTQSISSVGQTADKISWLVKSGTSASNFALTDRAITQVAETISLDGFVKFTNLSQVNTATIINGGNITTGTIDASKATITNINATNIKTGNLNANRINGGTLNCNNITVTNLSANSITTGTLDANKAKITNINASNISTGNLSATRISGGTLDANKITVTNLSASSITTGTLDASKIAVTNLSASNITTGGLDISRITASTKYVMSYERYYDAIMIGGQGTYGVNNAWIYGNTTRIGNGTSSVGFFGNNGATRQKVSKIPAGANTTTIRTAFNNFIDAIRAYNLVYI